MKNGKKIIVIMPAYNAELTLEKTYKDIPKDVVNEIILTDDASSDGTVEIAKKLGMVVNVHNENMGYGANQKTCYDDALKRDADIIVMIHPDYQYDPNSFCRWIYQHRHLRCCHGLSYSHKARGFRMWNAYI
jgi:glycosyltransferase involved in cell wall biosynthesis